MKKDFYLTRYALIIKRLESSPATYAQLEEYLLGSFEFQDAKITGYSIRACKGILKKSPAFSTLISITKRKATTVIT